ncbi:receptor-like protein kinase ANXUR2 [Arachis duranensis]|uniref:Receptor-like protein kinase ANXUR2 n=1 Tax=Arachis duranensis TaxID=130453 RepID=A0A9C6TXN8_ARADU|nr:receptor-like protein kinase ANXUR2 [Arachis duranensis]
MTGNFNETKIIGKGSFGELYQGRVRLKGLTDNYYYLIAIKKMHWPSICYSEMQFKFREEIEKICVLRHPNLVSLLGFCNDDGDAVAAAAAADDDYNNDDAKILDYTTFTQHPFFTVTQGLHYLTNILLDRAMVPKLSDFGFPWSNPIHAGCYAAPEWSEGHDFTDKCDVYSFGIVLLQVVFTSKLPLIEGESDPILKGMIAPQCWEVFLDITRRCLKFGPNERPTINKVMTQLEHALALQEEADANTSDEYNLLSITFDDDALLGRRLC